MRGSLLGPVAAALVCALLGGCGCSRREVPSGPDVDVHTDPDADPGDAPVDRVDPDITADPGSDAGDVVGEEDEPPAPFCPPEGPVGPACTEAAECGESMNCLAEASHTFDGLLYVDWPGGYCVDSSWSAGCDPAAPDACPEGARCVHLGTARCEDRWACLDACAPVDTAGVPFDFNACCRGGYRCDRALGVCLPGCMSDRECCEAWSDADGDTVRDDGEVARDGDCTRTCDGDLFVCTGPGDGTYASACTFDSDCPDEARCLPEGCHSLYGGSFAGGLCIRERCDLEGVDCAAGSGACVALAAGGETVAVCLAACHTGMEPGDTSSPCRDAYACVPACDGDWVGPGPAGGEDGTCFTANLSAAAPETLYEPCTGHGECHSPLGLGLCLETAGQSRCSVRCNRSLAEAHDVCGAPATSGGPALGACWQCACRKACDDPSAPLGADSCTASGTLACYATSALFGEIAYSTGAAAPAGLCLPACADTADCAALWGMPLACDVTTGTCS